jgi:hypothetical protein
MQGGLRSTSASAAVVAIAIACGACGGGNSTPKALGVPTSQLASTTSTTGLHQKDAIQFADPPVTAVPFLIISWMASSAQDEVHITESLQNIKEDVTAQDQSSIVGACASLRQDAEQLAKDLPSPEPVLNADLHTALTDLENVANKCVTGDLRGFLTDYNAARTEFGEAAQREKTLAQAPLKG